MTMSKNLTVNFKIDQLSAYSKQEAMDNAKYHIQKDATQAWKNAGMPQIGAALKEFCAEYLKKNTKNAPGVGCLITLTPGVSDTKEKPFKVENIKNEKGKRKYTTAYQLVDVETGKLLKTVVGTKKDAEKVAKEFYVDGEFRGTIRADYTKIVTEGEKGAFLVKYSPSKSTKLGSYLAFGIEA